MNFIQKWCDDIQSRTPMPLPGRVAVSVVRKAHLGPRIEYARIDVVAEPACEFKVAFGPDLDHDGANGPFFEAAILGVLDVLLVREMYPLRNVRFTFVGFDANPIESSQMAFRRAGREAGEKIIAACTTGVGFNNVPEREV